MLLTLRLCLAALFAASACNETSVTEQLKPLQLLHFSDLHGSALHLQRIVEYMDSHDVDDAIHTGDGVMCYYDDANVFESVPGGRRVLNAIGNHDCWKGHLLWSQTDKPYDATKEEAYSRFFVGPDPRHPTIAEWKVCQPEGVNDVQSPDYQACYYYKDYPSSSNPGAVQVECMLDCAFDPVDRFIDEGGTFVCWLSGHNHNDYVGYVKNHERQLQILVDKAGELDRYMLDSDRSGENTDAFNLVSYNPVSKLLTVQRVGCADGYHGKRIFTRSAVSRLP